MIASARRPHYDNAPTPCLDEENVLVEGMLRLCIRAGGLNARLQPERVHGKSGARIANFQRQGSPKPIELNGL